MKELFCVGERTDVFDTLSSRWGFETRRFDSVGDCLESMTPDAGGFVVGYESVGDIGEAVERARETAPDTSIVVLSESMPREPGYTGPAVFDFVVTGDRGTVEVAETVRDSVTGGSQRAYPVPEDEDERLEAVRELGGEGDAGGFTRLTRIARRHFDVDLAFVGIVGEDSERFLSCQGADMDEIPRESSVCTFQILEEGVMVVEDLSEDARFEGNELVEEVGRFYAGAPLTTPSGANVGSFCIMDSEPRRLSDEERETLRLFAEEATERLVRVDAGE